ncbi:DUF3150 domain-containing protein [Maridesulfovibrio ferrireducens]|uniref:DUF3150 domain-containing protein n=1 Tax=Maridesulfovibrio ferrireducens TaxID=246191 RepID=UPI001A1BE1C4|nr:DUF3150 domain-containing protein [Maridesulfovibrio ferrireducens]MBI9113194.1 DUF3150 domain-containing protein [Maridesulfovibrio ferrireducens]
METKTRITVLNHILALNLDVNIWSARKKLTPADFGGSQLPPEELASLGSKRICNPEELRIFGTLKSRAVNMLDRHGIRFLGGWGVPEKVADEIVKELEDIQKDFFAANEDFLNRYDEAVQDWIKQYPGWEKLIGSSTVSAEYVRSRMGFKWQFFKLSAPEKGSVKKGLKEEINKLGGTLFDEIAKTATDTWNKCYAGKVKVTHKALSPLRSIHSKLNGLSFVDPRVLPITDLLQTAFEKVPPRGLIRGADLLMLQGVVSLLRDPTLLINHGQKLLDGYKAEDLLDGLITVPTTSTVKPIPETSNPTPTHMTQSETQHQIDSHGLW